MMPSNIMTKAAVSRLATWRQIIEFSAIKNIVWFRQKYLNTTKWPQKIESWEEGKPCLWNKKINKK